MHGKGVAFDPRMTFDPTAQECLQRPYLWQVFTFGVLQVGKGRLHPITRLKFATSLAPKYLNKLLGLNPKILCLRNKDHKGVTLDPGSERQHFARWGWVKRYSYHILIGINIHSPAMSILQHPHPIHSPGIFRVSGFPGF